MLSAAKLLPGNDPIVQCFAVCHRRFVLIHIGGLLFSSYDCAAEAKQYVKMTKTPVIRTHNLNLLVSLATDRMSVSIHDFVKCVLGSIATHATPLLSVIESSPALVA